MIRSRAVVLVGVLGLLASCGADGGQRGSGITSALGNVVSADGAAVAGVQVSVEDTNLRTTTGGDGRFTVRGHFEGYSTLRFERDDPRGPARLGIIAPAGGVLTLHNVQLDEGTGTAHAEIVEVVFDGVVVASDCGIGRITMASTHRAADDMVTYVVDLAGSSLHRRDGTPLACGDLHLDDRVAVHGRYATDGTIGDADLEVR